MKEEMNKLKEAKENHFKVVKMDRILKNEWRHGVLGQAASKLGVYKDDDEIEEEEVTLKDRIGPAKVERIKSKLLF